MALENALLYVVTTEPVGMSYHEMVEETLRGGADVIQFRDTTTRSDRERYTLITELLDITHRYHVPLIVNNRLDLALATYADGVHLGQDDIPIDVARTIAHRSERPDLVIGISTHSVEQAHTAEKSGADYIGIGPVFCTPTKPTYTPIGLDVARHVCTTLMIPTFAIGSISEQNLPMICEHGITRVAVVRAVCAQPDIQHATARLKKLLKRNTA